MKKNSLDYLLIVLGTAIAGFGIACFSAPAHIAPGGVSGLATIMYYATGLDTGMIMLSISVPLFLLGIKIFGPLYGAKGFIGMLLLSVFVTLFGQLTQYQGFLDYSSEVSILLSSAFGGVVAGAGIGLVMKVGSNTGGTDILAQILARYTSIPVGSALLLFDGLVVITGGFFFGFESALFALVEMFCASQTVNYVLMNMGNNYAKTAYIVSNKYQDISERVLAELDHGGTILEGTGIFSGQNRKMLMTVVPNRKITALTRIVHEEDAFAFMFVLETYQVLGHGFVPMKKALERNKNASDSFEIPKKAQRVV